MKKHLQDTVKCWPPHPPPFFWQSFLYSTDQRKLNLSAMLLARSGIFSWTNSLYSCKLYMSTRQTWQATCYWNHSGQHHRLVFATHVLLYLKVADQGHSVCVATGCGLLWSMIRPFIAHNCLVSELTVLEQGVMSWWLKKARKKRRSFPSTGFILHALCCNSYAIIHHNPTCNCL